MEILELINSGSRRLKDKNIYSHKLDSEILLSKVLNKTREELLINLKQKIEPQKISNFHRLIDRRSSKEPIAYILEKKEFWSKSFLINNNEDTHDKHELIKGIKITTFFLNRYVSSLGLKLPDVRDRFTSKLHILKNDY